MSRDFPLPHAGTPTVQLLGNADFAIHAGSDGSRALHFGGHALNRWHPGVVPAGTDVLLRDLADNRFWSVSGQPYGDDGSAGEVRFESGIAHYRRTLDDLATTLSVAVDPDHGGEIASLEIRNTGATARDLEVASVMALVLGDARADASHPAYAKMFVVTETADDGDLILARRRPRSNDQPTLWAAQGCRVDGVEVSARGFETDRLAILGRDRNLRHPALFDSDTATKGSSGVVLDPMLCLRRGFSVAAGASARITFRTVVGNDRATVLDVLHSALVADVTASLAAAASADTAAQKALKLDPDGVTAASAVAGALLRPDNAWRASAEVRLRGRGGQPALWPYSISGDRPIVALKVAHADQSGLLDDLLRAQRFWLARGLAADLVVLAAGDLDAVHARVAADGPAKDAGVAVFVLDDGKLDGTAHDVIGAAAAAVLDAAVGDLAHQAAARAARTELQWPPAPISTRGAGALPAPEKRFAENGIGGFSADGREYRIDLGGGQHTPAPWSNIMANEGFGCVVTSSGGGYAWTVNSQQNRITPWANDPVSDPPGDAIYLRCADTGAVWCPTPAPIPDELPCRVVHARGHTRFERIGNSIESELTVFTAATDAVRISRLRLVNHGSTARRIDVTAFARWTLEAIGRDGGAHTACWRDAASGALFARNRWRKDFAERVAFLAIDRASDNFSCDADAFLGPRRDPAAPAALAESPRLDGREGIGLDPCAALATRVELPAGGEVTLLVLLGQGRDEADAQALAKRYRAIDADAELARVTSKWDEVTGAIQIETPDKRNDILVNHWLPYQVLSCRVWGRTAYYQASGAYGFRDQLQDIMALALSRPDVARAHILRSAARQFPEGDVQHWWLPPEGAGVRTHIVDDRVWLPYVVAHYVRNSGDAAILDEVLPFLDAPPLNDGQVDSFTTPATSSQTASLYEHCARALEVSFTNGAHGLPLFGRGDWNDGMNLVGKDGKGESVWMAWFLVNAIGDFAPFADARGDGERADRWRKHADQVVAAAEEHAWDGNWWTRGWYDNGHPLGVSASRECRIDTIAQSWSVMCGKADRARAREAMESVVREAVYPDARLIALFTPAFDTSKENPGYIKGYPPGLRENGGQYTHGVIWSAVAFAELGDGDRAGHLLQLLNPISHGDSAERIATYKVEPYVTCGDLYTAEGHLGRGGWTWYSGSGGWLFRAIVEWQLGIRVDGDALKLAPCIPRDWPGFSATLRRGKASYRIRVDNPAGVSGGIKSVTVDGTPASDPAAAIALTDDGGSHEVIVELG